MTKYIKEKDIDDHTMLEIASDVKEGKIKTEEIAKIVTPNEL